jgi:hypothetical protein
VVINQLQSEINALANNARNINLLKDKMSELEEEQKHLKEEKVRIDFILLLYIEPGFPGVKRSS